MRIRFLPFLLIVILSGNAMNNTPIISKKEMDSIIANYTKNGLSFETLEYFKRTITKYGFNTTKSGVANYFHASDIKPTDPIFKLFIDTIMIAQEVNLLKSYDIAGVTKINMKEKNCIEYQPI